MSAISASSDLTLCNQAVWPRRPSLAEASAVILSSQGVSRSAASGFQGVFLLCSPRPWLAGWEVPQDCPPWVTLEHCGAAGRCRGMGMESQLEIQSARREVQTYFAVEGSAVKSPVHLSVVSSCTQNRCAASSHCTQSKSRNHLMFLLRPDFHTPPILNGLLKSPPFFQTRSTSVSCLLAFEEDCRL
ncbi:uncharacterized protein LOC143694633 [Agelaius phoeniceus]|uniref:uncharacterized protein LOC143694633 n=1 Tax=Agelaius phoeniceus TaxID=39638 RepID=UPI0040550203